MAQNHVIAFQNKNRKTRRYGGTPAEFFTGIVGDNPESFAAFLHNGRGFVSFTECSYLKLFWKKNKQSNQFLFFKITKNF